MSRSPSLACQRSKTRLISSSSRTSQGSTKCGADGSGQRPDAPLDERGHGAEPDLGALVVQCPGDAPGDRMVVGDAEHQRLLALEQAFSIAVVGGPGQPPADPRPGHGRGDIDCRGPRAGGGRLGPSVRLGGLGLRLSCGFLAGGVGGRSSGQLHQFGRSSVGSAPVRRSLGSDPGEPRPGLRPRLRASDPFLRVQTPPAPIVTFIRETAPEGARPEHNFHSGATQCERSGVAALQTRHCASGRRFEKELTRPPTHPAPRPKRSRRRANVGRPRK